MQKYLELSDRALSSRGVNREPACSQFPDINYPILAKNSTPQFMETTVFGNFPGASHDSVFSIFRLQIGPA